MLGIPGEHHEMFLNGARDGWRLLDPVPLTRAELDAANAANLGASAYFQQLYFSASLSIVRLLGFSLMVTSPD